MGSRRELTPETTRTAVESRPSSPPPGLPSAFVLDATVSLASREILAESLIQAQNQENHRQQVAALVRINQQLQAEMEARTAQLQQALAYEAALKRITDRVRDSLDEHQICKMRCRSSRLSWRRVAATRRSM
ncbi:MAG: hypothetical protein HC771_21390, partial [Synechococcales cyanobacterium CRU_2_2]|nr:hypothetical protein [Synechococcales cyanobacterium CRU_2_2]